MNVEATLVLTVLVVSLLLTGWVRKMALAHDVLDIPNNRSSHVAPTPRGGGFAIVVSAVLGFVVLWCFDSLPLAQLMALGGGGICVAIVGFFDDRRHLRASVRLTVHFLAALWAMVWLGGLPPLQLGEATIEFGWGGYLLGAVGIVWTLNLFNFMDGIDGIAGSEAVFITCSGAMVALLTADSGGPVAANLVLAAACCGFLWWNWPPARIFMGDVGSGFLGYIIAVMAIISAVGNPVALLVWVILGGIFFIDATVTLVRRVARGERVHEAHRSHAYQWLTRRWNSHRRVTLGVWVVNLLWLLPCALLAGFNPRLAALMVGVALAPVGVLAVAVGAGRSDSSSRSATSIRSKDA